MKKSLLVILVIIALLAAGGGYWYYQQYQLRNTVIANSNSYLYIPTNSTQDDVYAIITSSLPNHEPIIKLLKKTKLNKIYPGRYSITQGMKNEDLVKRLQLGEQDEIEIMIGNYSSVYELTTKIAPFFETSKEQLMEAISQLPENKNLDTLQWIYTLSPNTYKFHWTNTPSEIIKKIQEPYLKFWQQNNRQTLLQQSGLTELQVISLASIVQLESYKVDEQPSVAGLYLNRVKIGMKLDADPTVIFSKKIQEGWDKKIQRVYYKDLNISSPYNTYRNKGIPPGPICMPNPSAIDAVLQPEQHSYIYFVADPARVGYHLFATNLAEHEKNAAVYRNWANQNNVK